MGKQNKQKSTPVTPDKTKNKSNSKPSDDTVKPVSIRQQLFGNWTGKVPVSLLNEHCQREGWKNPIYNINETKHKGFQCKISLTRHNKKTNELDVVTFYDKNEFYASQQLAKHSSATYCLHRICSHLSLGSLLPPIMRDIWNKCEKVKGDSDPDMIPINYAKDPFSSEEKRLNKLLEQTASEQATPWLEYPSIHIPKQLRDELESLIRSNLNSAVEGTFDSKTDTKYVKQMLLKKGFRKAHVEEALQYRSDLTSAMDWLCIHIPEDDLPVSMRPVDKKSIVLQNHTSDSLSREYVIERLMKTGFSRYHCDEHLTSAEDDEYLALSSICHTLAGIEKEIVTVVDVEEKDSLINEELEALESIYGDQFQHEALPGRRKFVLNLELSGPIELYISDQCNYPHEIPAMVFSESILPAYIRLGIVKNVLIDCVSFIGAPMIFSIISSIEEHTPLLIDNPPLLESLYPKRNAINFSVSSTKNHQKNNRRNGPSTSKSDSDELLLQAHKKKISLPEYKKMLTIRLKLPSYKFKEEICHALAENQGLVICGETGCGKSTQLGQFILDQMIESGNGSKCNIICTQPRRISAIALADRVANERIEKVGNEIGYSIRGESKQSNSTKLLFCTTGVLLRMIQDNPDISHISHVIVDEVHERGVDSDFLLVLLKDLMNRRPDIRVVLMSATIDANTFTDYLNCQSLEIPGFTHPVQNLYLENIIEATGYIPENSIKSRKFDQDSDEEWGDAFENISNITKNGIKKLIASEKDPAYKIDYGLISATVQYICENNDSGAILIFLPGVMEIKKCIDRIKTDLRSILDELEIFPLHSNLTSSEQSAVFRKMKTGIRKVVVSTNIAETSVTIDDVVFVIDTGRVKEMKLINNVLSLTETWASKAACKQRRGRAGRVQPGIVYKLYSSFFEAKHMKRTTDPEILRLPLEQLCLQIKTMGVNDVVDFLGKALSPPPTPNILTAIDLLENLNAIDEKGVLTALGRHISLIPTDIRIAKMLVYGAIFHCIDPILTVAACMSGKSPFNSPMDKRDEASEAQAQFSQFKSDHLMACKAYKEWSELPGKGSKYSFCEKNFLSMTTLQSIHDLRKQFKDILKDLGYIKISDLELLNSNSENEKVVKAVLLAGLYPNIASIVMPKQLYDQTSSGSVAITAKSSEIRYFVKNDGRVFIHPSSSLFKAQKYEESVLVYSSKVATSKIFLRDCSAIPSIALLLLGGKIELLHGGRSLSIDNIRFQSFPRVTSLITGMRRLLDGVLLEKINHPSLDVIQSEVGQLCLSLIQHSQ
ncbi:hypothetical protein HDV02_003025 [Globomyces sp. JEL0801]|nr:hypothetical protein HDV02_003025 [Globomyces sp. JEL0801]